MARSGAMDEDGQVAEATPPAARRYAGSLYWDARPQTLAAYATTLCHCLDQLRPRAPVLERWYVEGSAGATLLDERAVERVLRELEASRSTWEFDGVQYSGSKVTVSNVRKGPRRCELALSCGITVPSTSIWFANSLSFEAWCPSEAFPDLPSFQALIALLVTNFAPAWASVVTPQQEERSLEEIYGGVPQVGWFTVFEPAYGVPPPSAAYDVRVLANGSHLLRLIDEPFDERNSEHHERRRQAEQTLRKAGFLRRRLPA
jgi:hypothetical protein